MRWVLPVKVRASEHSHPDRGLRQLLAPSVILGGPARKPEMVMYEIGRAVVGFVDFRTYPTASLLHVGRGVDFVLPRTVYLLP